MTLVEDRNHLAIAETVVDQLKAELRDSLTASTRRCRDNQFPNMRLPEAFIRGASEIEDVMHKAIECKLLRDLAILGLTELVSGIVRELLEDEDSQ